METENPASFQYMSRAFRNPAGSPSLISSSSSGSFSDCSSDRSGDFASSAAACSLARRILVSSAAAAAAASTSASSSSSYTDDLIRSLVADLESPSSSLDSQRRAAMELRLLAKHDPDNRLRIARAGAVRPLVSLLSHPDPQLQEHGVTALLNLSLRDENKDLIASAGAIRPLVRALKSGGTAATRENAACALLRLAQARGDDDGSASQHRLAIGRSGAIPFLVDLLETGGIRGKKDAATALYMLCSSASSRENKARAVQAGVVRPLLELMADPESGMVDKAAYVLAAVVVGVPEARVKVVEEGGVPVLVEMVETGTQRHKEIAADVLLYVCEESVAYRGMVSREGALPPLVALSQSGSSRGKKKAEALIELLRQPRPAVGSSRD